MQGKLYMVRCCGSLQQFDTEDERDDMVGAIDDPMEVKLFNHYPSEAEYDQYMADATEYFAKIDEENDAKRRKLGIYVDPIAGDASSPDTASTHEYELGDVPVPLEGELVADVILDKAEPATMEPVDMVENIL